MITSTGNSRSGDSAPIEIGGSMSLDARPLRPSLVSGIWPYLSIARPDHWFKNVFMVAGVILALFYHPELIGVASLERVLLAVVTTCFIVSSNYVLNEILDAPTDLSHTVKHKRPIPSALV